MAVGKFEHQCSATRNLARCKHGANHRSFMLQLVVALLGLGFGPHSGSSGCSVSPTLRLRSVQCNTEPEFQQFPYHPHMGDSRRRVSDVDPIIVYNPYFGSKQHWIIGSFLVGVTTSCIKGGGSHSFLHVVVGQTSEILHPLVSDLPGLWLARNEAMNPYSSAFITHYGSFDFLFHSFIPS